jgi:predicted acyltransferase
MTNREISLDVLRGLGIVGMVLSGTISRNPDLPAWLFHAQIAPPDFTFNPNLPGITWVDLVFPFFLFAMGMAFPFALNRSLDNGIPKRKIIRKIISRSLKAFLFRFFPGTSFSFSLSAGTGMGTIFPGIC